MGLADGTELTWITTGSGVSAESPGAVSAVIKDPMSGDDEEQSPIEWWLARLPGAGTA